MIMVLTQPLLLPTTVEVSPTDRVLLPDTIIDCTVIDGRVLVRVLTGHRSGISFELPYAMLPLRMRPATPLEALVAGNDR